MNSSLHDLRSAGGPMPPRAIPEPRKIGRALVFAALLICGAAAGDARASAAGTQPLFRIAQATAPQAPNAEAQTPYPASEPAQGAPAQATGVETPAAGGPTATPMEPVQRGGEAASGAPMQAPDERGAAEPMTEAGEPGAADPLTEPLEAQAPSREAFGAEDELLPRDLSPMGMFMNADIVVKAVMVGLALASFLTWVIWLAKSLELFGARGRARKVLTILNDARTLDDVARQIGANGRGPAALMVSAAREEAKISEAAINHAGGAGLKDRVASALDRIEIAAGRGMARGTGVLATIGSTAPFVGLFGTVWGIMNSFIGISEAQTTNLAVVAPGIAEALLATALGLVAAIPAVIIYNAFARSIVSYRQLLADTASAVQRLVSRDLDFRGLPASRSAGAPASEAGKMSRRVLAGQEAN